MSDCSSQEMIPKERRTCGTCGRSFTARKVMPQCMCELDELDDSGCMPTHDDNEGACCRWIAKPAIIEQRCERLAQVARDLEELAHFAILHIENDLVIGPAVDRLVILRNKLRECGVSVDDVERDIQASDA